MPDLSTNCAGIKSPNPFWLASAPPTNSGAQVIVLTGDAGHGKTHLCRRIIEGFLGYDEEEARKLIIEATLLWRGHSTPQR